MMISIPVSLLNLFVVAVSENLFIHSFKFHYVIELPIISFYNHDSTHNFKILQTI
jgi:hypothetical protein